MQFYEYIIIAVALFLVVLPFILHRRNKKKGKSPCGCDCSKCGGNCFGATKPNNHNKN